MAKQILTNVNKQVAAAAAIYGCKVSDLLAYSVKANRTVVIIAPTGQKFTYTAEQIAKVMTPKPQRSPAGKTPAKKATAGRKKAAPKK